MAFRFNKRIKIAKGLHLNVGKKGLSTSVKIGNTTINSKGRMTTSIPGTGLSYSTNLNKGSKSEKSFIEKMEDQTNKSKLTIEKINEMNNKVGNKNNYYLSVFTYILSFVLLILSLILMLVNPILGGCFLLFSITLNRVSNKNKKKYKLLFEEE